MTDKLTVLGWVFYVFCFSGAGLLLLGLARKS